VDANDPRVILKRPWLVIALFWLRLSQPPVYSAVAVSQNVMDAPAAIMLESDGPKLQIIMQDLLHGFLVFWLFQPL
jgi:hypothetical protein